MCANKWVEAEWRPAPRGTRGSELAASHHLAQAVHDLTSRHRRAVIASVAFRSILLLDNVSVCSTGTLLIGYIIYVYIFLFSFLFLLCHLSFVSVSGGGGGGGHSPQVVLSSFALSLIVSDAACLFMFM